MWIESRASRTKARASATLGTKKAGKDHLDNKGGGKYGGRKPWSQGGKEGETSSNLRQAWLLGKRVLDEGQGQEF